MCKREDATKIAKTLGMLDVGPNTLFLRDIDVCGYLRMRIACMCMDKVQAMHRGDVKDARYLLIQLTNDVMYAAINGDFTYFPQCFTMTRVIAKLYSDRCLPPPFCDDFIRFGKPGSLVVAISSPSLLNAVMELSLDVFR